MDNSYRPDPNRTHTEAVAQAMREYARQSCVHPRDARYFERLAEVAIEAHTAALGLTEERGVIITAPHGARRIESMPHIERVKDLVRTYPERVQLASRLTSDWVAVPDSGGEQ